MKSLDFLMINNGGCDPFHYLKHTMGRGGLGYKPSPPFMRGIGYDPYEVESFGMAIKGDMRYRPIERKSRMIGGMAGIDPDDPNKIFLGRERFIDSDSNTKDINPDIIEELEDRIKEGDTNETAINFIIKELIDFDAIRNKHNSKAIDNYTKIFYNMANELGITDEELDEKKLEKELKASEKPTLYQSSQKNTTSDMERGDNTEIILEKDPNILSNIDGDQSKVYNTKDINSESFNPKFVEALVNISKERGIKKGERDAWIKKNYLQYFPVDFTKKNTLWEIKSHSGKNKKSQTYSTTKIEGYRNPYEGSVFDIVYIPNPSNPNKKMVKNIYFNHGNEAVPVLNDNPNGYNYLTLFNNEDRRSYYNPMIDEKLETKGITIGKEGIEYLKHYGLSNSKGLASRTFDTKLLKNLLKNEGVESSMINDEITGLKDLWLRLKETNSLGNNILTAKLQYGINEDDKGKKSYVLPTSKFMTYSDNLMRRKKKQK
jgi:hypothetical protein